MAVCRTAAGVSVRLSMGTVLLLLGLVIGIARPVLADDRNVFDRSVPHPAIPLVDEDGRHVLETGKPYSTRMSCGNGSGGGCHDYESMNHAYHFEQGRDETRDDFGQKRGIAHLVGPGYFGGYNCMQGSMTAALAKKSNASEAEFGDFGAAGYIKACSTCHLGGGWEEKDRNGNRYDLMPDVQVPALDGDYFDRDSSGSVVRWDWRKSGVREADCLTCHIDFKLLKKFPASQLGGNDGNDGTAGAQEHWGKLQDGKFVQAGLFRYANSAMLEFLNLRPDLPEGLSLLTVARTIKPGSTGPDYDLTLDGAGNPAVQWNRAAFDASGKVTLPMLRFPGNDNCMTCHLAGAGINRITPQIKSSRRGFYGFGAEAASELDKDFNELPDFHDDVHKGVSWTDDTGETRIIDNCNACHAKQYYKPLYKNIDLDANHDFPKGNGDADVRNDLDYQPGPKSCEYCHGTAKNSVFPKSGQKTLLAAHRGRWLQDGWMLGYAPNTYDRVVQVHFDDIDCQGCHSPEAVYDGKNLPVHYRYRIREDGKTRAIPYVPSARFFARDKTSGRVLYRYERQAVLQRRPNGDGSEFGVIVDPAGGQQIGRVPVSGGEFDLPNTYADFKALKQAYDHLLAGKGYANPNVTFVYAETNQYILTHQTRTANRTVPCEGCHNKRQNGSINGAVAIDGLMGDGRNIEMTRLPDARLASEGVVEMAAPYHKVQADGRITENVGEVLDYSETAPDMTLLKSSTGRVVSGPLSIIPADQGPDFTGLNADGANKLMAKMNSGEWLAFRAKLGHPSLRDAGLVFPGDQNTRILMEGMRVELASHEVRPEEKKRIRRLQTGRLVSDVYALTVTRGSQPPGGDFGGIDGWLKLPYTGAANKGPQVRLVYSDNGKRWRRIRPRSIVLFQPRVGDVAGYVVAQVKRPTGYFALTDTVRRK